MNTTRLWVADLLASFSGQENVLTIPRPYIDVTGNIEDALLLSQIIYWTDRTKMDDGWFAKSYSEWTDEITLSKYQVMAATKRLGEAGVETMVRKFNGAPTVHYRLRKSEFELWIVKKLDERKSRNLTIDSEETERSSTETTTETTTETIARKREKGSKSNSIPAPQMTIMKNAIVAAFGWHVDTMTKGEWGIVQATAKELCTVGFEADRVSSLYAWCKAKFKTFSPRALSTHLSEYRATRLDQPEAPDLPRHLRKRPIELYGITHMNGEELHYADDPPSQPPPVVKTGILTGDDISPELRAIGITEIWR